MDERELRRIARQRFDGDIPEWVWELLRVDRYLDDDYDESEEEVLSRIRTLLQITRRPEGTPRRSPGTTGTRAKTARLSPSESLRASAASDYYANDAERSGAVRRFREYVLAGRLLSGNQMRNVLTSPAAQLFHPDQFVLANVPVAEHLARIVSERAVYQKFYNAVIHVDPPGVDWMFDRQPLPSDVWW